MSLDPRLAWKENEDDVVTLDGGKLVGWVGISSPRLGEYQYSISLIFTLFREVMPIENEVYREKEDAKKALETFLTTEVVSRLILELE